MTTDTKYNGWTNYETWNYALWLDNDEGSEGYWNERAEEAFANAEADKSFTRAENATFALKDELQAQCEEAAEEWMPKQARPFSDAVNAYVSEINWYEIASHYIESVEQGQSA